MEQKVKVRRLLPNGMAQVVLIRESACSGDCHKCSGCGAAKETLVFEACDPIGVQPGDVVVVESDTGPVLKAATVLYVLPLLLFFAGYALGAVWNLGALAGGLGFALGIGIVLAYDRHMAKHKNTVYTIKRRVSNSG